MIIVFQQKKNRIQDKKTATKRRRRRNSANMNVNVLAIIILIPLLVNIAQSFMIIFPKKAPFSLLRPGSHILQTSSHGRFTEINLSTTEDSKSNRRMLPEEEVGVKKSTVPSPHRKTLVLPKHSEKDAGVSSSKIANRKSRLSKTSNLFVSRKGRKTYMIQALFQRMLEAWKRPGFRFRLAIGAGITVLFSLGTWASASSRIGATASGMARNSSKAGGVSSILALVSWKTVSKWLSHRGFQGLSALGRTVTYLWALLVAYPRLLDRRAKERRQKERADHLEQRRQYLRRLAQEVVRQRQEISTLDAEIRSFRREVIAMKAYGKQQYTTNIDTTMYTNTSSRTDTSLPSSFSSISVEEDVQEAIASEMAHLLRLREDAQAAMLAARKAWSEVRAKSPPEAWEDDEFWF